MTKFLTRPNVNGANVLLAGDTISIADGSGNTIASATSAPAGTERGLITRPIPSGTQTVTVSNGSIPAATGGSVATVLLNPPGSVASATIIPAGAQWALIEVTGTWSGSLNLTLTNAGSSWTPTLYTFGTFAVSGQAASAITANGHWFVPLHGATGVSVNGGASTGTSATVTLYGWAGPAPTQTSAAADAAANPTVATGLAAGLAYNGTTWDRARTLDAFKTAAASPDTGILATGLAERRFTSVSLGTVVGNTQTWDTEGAASVVVHCGTATTGTFTFEVSADGTNFYAAEVFEATTDRIYTAVNITPAANLVFRCYSAGIRTLRVRTVTTLGATVALTATASGFPPRMMTQDTGQGRTLQFASISAATSGNNTLVAAAAAGLKIKVVSYVLVADGTVTATFQSGAGGTGLSGAMALVANSGVSAISQPSSHLMETAAATLLNLSLSAAVGVRGHLSYFSEP